MKQKYTSLSAFIKGVAHVVEPSLTDGERLLLSGLVVSVNYKTGESRPGNQALMDITNRSYRGVQEILKFLRRKGLIETASQGNGRGLATVHRFRTEDARYPESRTEKPRSRICVDTTKEPRSTICGDSEENHAVEPEKPRRIEEETTQNLDGNHADTSAALPRISSYKSLPNPPTQKTEAVEMNDSNPTPKAADMTSLTPTPNPTVDYRQKVAKCFFETTKQILPKDSLDKAFLDRIPEKVWLSAKQYISNRDWTGLRRPSYFFDSEFESYYDADIVSPEEKSRQDHEEMLACRARDIAARRDEEEAAKRSKELIAALQSEELKARF